jgi:hypothetical protein
MKALKVYRLRCHHVAVLLNSYDQARLITQLVSLVIVQNVSILNALYISSEYDYTM